MQVVEVAGAAQGDALPVEEVVLVDVDGVNREGSRQLHLVLPAALGHTVGLLTFFPRRPPSC